MQKVVINIGTGGFGLSQKALERLIELGMTVGGYQDDCEIVLVPEKDRWDDEKYDSVNLDCAKYRCDPRVVQVVEELGVLAGDQFARLAVIVGGVKPQQRKLPPLPQ